MADSLTDVFAGRLSTVLTWSRVDTQEVGSITDKKTISATYSLVDGSGAGAADITWADTRTIAANSVDVLDLLALTQTEFGVSVPCTIRQLRVVKVANNETTSGKVVLVGADETSPTSVYAFAVGPGSEMLAINNTDSWVVTSSNNTLRIANPSSSSASYSIVLIGTATAAS